MRVKLAIGIVALGLCLAGTAARVAAHHAFAAEFDANKPIQFTGTITKMEWLNPHVWLHMEVKKPDGSTEQWAFEAGTPNVLFRRGFTKQSLTPGTVVKVDGYQAKDGTRRGERTRPDVPGRPQAVHGFVRNRRAVGTGAARRRHGNEAEII